MLSAIAFHSIQFDIEKDEPGTEHRAFQILFNNYQDKPNLMHILFLKLNNNKLYSTSINDAIIDYCITADTCGVDNYQTLREKRLDQCLRVFPNPEEHENMREIIITELKKWDKNGAFHIGNSYPNCNSRPTKSDDQAENEISEDGVETVYVWGEDDSEDENNIEPAKTDEYYSDKFTQRKNFDNLEPYPFSLGLDYSFSKKSYESFDQKNFESTPFGLSLFRMNWNKNQKEE